MTTLAENVFSDWKGMQTVLKQKPKFQFIIAGVIGLTSIFLFSLITYGTLPMIFIGLLFGAMYFTIFIAILNEAIYKTREEAKQRKRQEFIKLVRDTLVLDGKNINNEVLKDFIEKFMIALDGIPDDKNTQTYEPFNESWKNRIRSLENNDIDKDEIMKMITDVKTDVDKLKEKEQIISKKAQTKNNDENSEIPKDEKFE